MTDSTALAPESTRTPVEQLLALGAGFTHCQGVLTAAELELADHLANGPLSLEDLASRANAHAPSLFRLLRALESIGVFKQASPRVFANTPMSELLRKDVPGSLWAYFRAMFACGWYEAWKEQRTSIRTGKPAFDRVHGCSIWEYQRRDPNRAAIFDASMGAMQAAMTPVVTAVHDWSRYPAIADIGGGTGAQLVDILKTHPSCRGILFDQPNVIAQAIPHDRIERVGGSFFERVPPGADAYILRSVIHNWADAEAVALLKTIRAAVRPDSRVILIEQSVPETPEFAFGKWSDLTMLTLAGGQERTLTEYRQLLEKAGFEIEQIVPTRAGISLIISRPRA